jgi:hypothetical protein
MISSALDIAGGDQPLLSARRLLTLMRAEALWPVCQQESKCHCRMPTIPTRTKPTKDDLVAPDEVYRWNPHTNAYAKNEEYRMDDVVGNVKPPGEREVRFVLDDLPEALISSLWVSPSGGPH